jgi:hypothetical protein
LPGDELSQPRQNFDRGEPTADNDNPSRWHRDPYRIAQPLSTSQTDAMARAAVGLRSPVTPKHDATPERLKNVQFMTIKRKKPDFVRGASR